MVPAETSVLYIYIDDKSRFSKKSDKSSGGHSHLSSLFDQKLEMGMG